MQRWATNVKNVQEHGRVKQAIVVANNHYAGFGPGTVKVFRNMLGLSEAKWEEREEEQQEARYHPRDEKQRSQADFMS